MTQLPVVFLWANSQNTLTNSCGYCKVLSYESTFRSSIAIWWFGICLTRAAAAHGSVATPQGGFGRDSHREGHKQHWHFSAAMLGVLSALYRSLCQSSVLNGYFSVALQRRLLFFITCSNLLQKEEKESGLPCPCAVPSIHICSLSG